MSRTFRIIHEAPAAPGVSSMEVAQVEASTAEKALLAWCASASKVSRLDDGTPCLRFGFGDVVLRQYTAVPVEA